MVIEQSVILVFSVLNKEVMDDGQLDQNMLWVSM